MTAAQLVRELINLVTPEAPVEAPAWPVAKVEALVKRLGFEGYEFDLEPKVVILSRLDDLYALMNYAGHTELSESCRMSMSKFKRKLCLEIAGWQFEAEDTE